MVLGQHPPAAQFPAGVDPAKCPSYPNCDNAYLHNTQPQQQWNAPQQQWNAPQPQWNAPQPQWNAPAQNQWNAPAQDDWTQWDEPAQQQWNEPAQQQWNAPNAWNAPAVHGPSSNQLPGAGGDK